MELNPDVLDVLKEFKIDKDQGLFYLLGIYFGLDVEKVCNEDTIKAMNLTKIVEKDYTNKKNPIKWNMPLFKGMLTEWEWVKKEYNELWNINRDRKDAGPDCIKRMQEWFKKYPQYRKDHVIRATQNYIKSLSSAQYIKSSAKFIFDGAGADKKSMLLGWCERLQDGGSSTQMRGTLVQ